MGLRKVSCSIYDEKKLPNPKSNNYTINHYTSFGKYTAISITYHDCTNYEGKKILVFKCIIEDLKKQKLIDPHFSENKSFYSPIARFEPTQEGWFHAIKYMEMLCQ